MELYYILAIKRLSFFVAARDKSFLKCFKIISEYFNIRSSRSQKFFKINVLKISQYSQKKHLRWTLFRAERLHLFLKKDSITDFSLWIFWNLLVQLFLKTTSAVCSHVPSQMCYWRNVIKGNQIYKIDNSHGNCPVKMPHDFTNFSNEEHCVRYLASLRIQEMLLS